LKKTKLRIFLSCEQSTKSEKKCKGKNLNPRKTRFSKEFSGKSGDLKKIFEVPTFELD
jgi:hypothetical protein